MQSRHPSAAVLILISFALSMGLGCPATWAAGQSAYSTAHAPLLGAAWYPEQWPEARWDADLTLMERAHFGVVRVGEFAWSSMEPTEGDYEFGWLDRAIALAAKHHIAVVLGTPTDAPPAWLTGKYPQTLRIDQNGLRATHGNRRQFNYADPLYRKLCAEIVLRMAERYGHNADVIGWQIGNEYTDESFDPATLIQFQQFLRGQYKTLANLNDRWTTAYWSQTYSAWSQIPFPRGRGNPGLLLAYKHFVTATWRSFQNNQIDVLRPLIARTQFITTNIGGLAWSDNWDHYAITEDLDFASWDDYVGQGHLKAMKNGMLDDFVRGWKRQNFWVMETQPGSVNWAPINNSLAPGEDRALAWEDIGHGADALLYWQWRSALNGQEQYHGAIVGPDGKPNPLYPEVQQMGEEFREAHDALDGTAPRARIALLYTYDSRWAIDFQPHTREYDQEQILLRFYEPLEKIAEANGEAVDIVDPSRGSLDGYRLLVAPSLNVIDDALAAKLAAWVRGGGHLLLGPRSGMKDQFDSLNVQRQPGPLVPELGARVEQYYAMDHAVRLAKPNDSSITVSPDAGADIWAEMLRPEAAGVAVDLNYIDPRGWLDHQPAMVTRGLGQGTIAYLGTVPDRETLDAIERHAADSAGIAPGTAPPEGFELCRRVTADGKRSVLIVINHSSKAGSVSLPASDGASFHPVLRRATGSSPTGTLSPDGSELTLPPQGVEVLVSEVHP